MRKKKELAVELYYLRSYKTTNMLIDPKNYRSILKMNS